MRPVRLDIDGFASFRQPASVVFDDVDYFALVGPTGSGKSTIIDAITFALYGTAHRWGHSRSVVYALAPTASRCTVSLIFDIGGQRYQVVREVRRSPSRAAEHKVAQKAARLERFADPTACPAPGDEPTATDILASEVRDVTPAVIQLLGMGFEDFCQCVVLPQGEFARFLKATSADRQKILLKLLGAERYDEVGREAGARARTADHEVQVHTDQLATYAHATPEAVARAAALRDDLATLRTETTSTVAAVLTAREEQEHHRAASQEAATAVAALTAVTVPTGLTDRHTALELARESRKTADATARKTTAALRAATRASDDGPQRGALERTEQVYADAERVTDELRTAMTNADALAEELKTTAEVAAGTHVAQEQARELHDLCRSEHDAAVVAHSSLVAQRDRLQAIKEPEKLSTVAEERAHAEAEIARARQHADEAQHAASEATAASARMPAAHEVDQAAQMCARLRETSAEWVRGQQALTGLRGAVIAANTARDAAGETRRLAGEALEQARRSDAASYLRPTLALGHDCPVCTQHVTTLPPPAPTGGVDLADREVEEAERHLRETDEKLQRAQRLHDAAEGRLGADLQVVRETATALSNEVTRLASQTGVELQGGAMDLPDGWTPEPHAMTALADHASDALARTRLQVVAAAADLTRAGEAASQAAQDLALATTAKSRIDEEATQLRIDLAQACTSVREDEPPVVDTDSLPATLSGWALLLEWRRSTAATITSTRLPEATTRVASAESALTTAVHDLGTASATATRQTKQATAAEARAAAAAATVHQLRTRLDDLSRQLVEAPLRDALPGLLTRADELARARRETTSAAEQANELKAEAEHTERAADAAVEADRDALRSARDSVAAWLPPAFDGLRIATDLPTCFAELASWAGERASVARDDAARAEAQATITGEEATLRSQQLAASLSHHGLDTSEIDTDPRAAERVVAVALTSASSSLEALEAARARLVSLEKKIDAARTTSLIAAELRSMLRADKFQQWLATAALDTLVLGASDNLLQLSDGQFTLTHQGGEFQVIDHFDADSPRSVKTLSGGETFQASLALALALAEQLAALAAGGTARLESIFLDEGFGTLDPEALDMVAATLENLAQGQRMVGVVTHVAALAERTPVRFLVSHDNRTSRVEREVE
ncbi:AAA family ATPase [Pimelobacter simplex]|uniref:AAA family ATPase n=1 Tax=Nocardioides simplex TaxID=2045 RepID=UPI003AAF297D